MLATDFPANLKALFDKIAPEDPLMALRKRAWGRLDELGLPAKKTENYRHIRLKKLYEQQYCFAEPAAAEFTPQAKNYLVFVNGQFQEHLSQVEGIEALPLTQAMGTYGAYLHSRYNKGENDPFAALNAALHEKGLFLYLPPKKVLKEPLQIIYIANTEHPALIMPRIHLFAGANAACDLLVTQVNLGSDYFQNSVLDLSLEEGARVTLTHISQGHPSFAFDAVRAHLKRNSFFSNVSVMGGSPCLRQDYRVALAQEGAEAHLNGVWQLEGHSEAHINVLVEHLAPACRSRQLFKGVLNDFSRSSFDGKIYVMKEAQATDAFQLNNNLLLSEHAQAFCKPNLEIFADDVKASHGATIGQLSEDEMFYMRTRGLDQITARKLLTTSFCQEVFDAIPQGIAYAH